jgi:prephenate dehydrogenase
MKITILGAGNMGEWLAACLREKHEIGVYDEKIERSKSISGVLAFKEISEIENFQPELLINAVSIQNTISVFDAVASHLPEKCIISDVMSVKGKISEYYKCSQFRFASCHPMFGPTFSNVDRLKDENVILIRESCLEGALFFRDFFRELGLRIFEYSFDEHDRLIAYSLTLPFASSLVFAANMDSSTVPGTTFKKHYNIAQGLLSESDTLLAEILFNPYSLPQLEKVTHELEFLKHVIGQRDFDEAKKFFNRLRENVQFDTKILDR